MNLILHFYRFSEVYSLFFALGICFTLFTFLIMKLEKGKFIYIGYSTAQNEEETTALPQNKQSDNLETSEVAHLAKEVVVAVAEELPVEIAS